MPNSLTDKNCAELCDCLLHPFQNDAGVSQNQRVMEDLLGGKAKIDARKTADLLDYFFQLSRHVNYYDKELQVSDWTPFFEKSAPFALASLIKYNANQTSEKFDHYNLIFDKKPTRAGLQLAQLFIFYNTVKRINNWYQKIKDTELPVERVFESIIKDKLRMPLQRLVILNRLASKWFCVNQIDFSAFFNAEIWGLDKPGSFAQAVGIEEESFVLSGDCDRLREIYKRTINIFSSLFEPIRILSTAAELSLEESILPLKEELKKKHAPHLGLLFAFLKLFEKLQGDLNGYTKKHLDFFYKGVLKIKPKQAVPDQAYLIFEIQKELKNYLLSKGLLVKDGKDVNKEEILFELDDQIVVNQAQVKDTRTLFLNNQLITDPTNLTNEVALIEGVYIAPDATKADGIDKDFQTGIKNFYTVGNKESKYILPDTNLYKPYPNARLGFILASPVLLLKEGTRNITITLQCEMNETICDDLQKKNYPASKRCCEEHPNEPDEKYEIDYPPFLSMKGFPFNFYYFLTLAVNWEYYYVSQELIQAAIKKGLSSDVADFLKSYLITTNEVTDPSKSKPYRFCPVETEFFDNIIAAAEFETDVDITLDIIKEFFPKRKPFNILFSGEKEWIKPSLLPETVFTITADPANPARFSFKIITTLNEDKDGVSFYDKEKLKEDFDTVLPLVKVELDDKFKLHLHYEPDIKEPNKICCLRRNQDFTDITFPFSLYHFFRNVIVIDKLGLDPNIHTDETQIEVQVCGLKNFVVQNDESVQDVNGHIYPFGTRPDIIDYTVVNPISIYCITQLFINDAVAGGLSNAAKTKLQGFIAATGRYDVGVDKIDVEKFLSTEFGQVADQNILKSLFYHATKNYCQVNFTGPNFYIGSREVFCKRWKDVFINFNWKDKPTDFRNYYKAYFAKLVSASPNKYTFGIDEEAFEINISVLQKGSWKLEKAHSGTPPPNVQPPYSADAAVFNKITKSNNRRLFPTINVNSFCTSLNPVQQSIYLKNSYFDQFTPEFVLNAPDFTRFDVNSKEGFIRINLQNQDFLHKDYPYVLARQMLASGKLPKELVEGAVYYDTAGDPIVISSEDLLNQFKLIEPFAKRVNVNVNVNNPPIGSIDDNKGIFGNAIAVAQADKIRHIMEDDNVPAAGDLGLKKGAKAVADFMTAGLGILNQIKNFAAVIPNEPWTPIIQGISIDYTASASIKDMELIHLYPFRDTYNPVEIELQPTLFPTFCDEGTLFLGIEKLIPGNNLNILFQLAEATADSESEKEDVHWMYLDNNVWKPLRAGFEVIDDATENLTTSGIIKFALPENMTKDNTVMPAGLHWIKATIPKNSRSVSETTGIHAQAIKITFTNSESNDRLRLNKPIEAGQISKLNEADASVKKLSQPYDSFGGQVPEGQGMFYVRISELLRHKGRAIQKFDYERIVLDAFPQIFRAKCINHSFGLNAHFYKNDFPYAPGYVIMAVIPDLFKLKAGNSFEPKLPVSLLEKIDALVRSRTSTFVRFRTMNPRYEKIHLSLKIKLNKGLDENYFREKLARDIREFLAPWAVGEYHKITFGQCVNRSEIIRFLESRNYMDFILELNMRHETEANYELGPDGKYIQLNEICPKTPRSILIAGDVEICIEKEACEQWEMDEKCNHEKIRLFEYCERVNR